MSLTVQTTLEITGDRTIFERASAALRGPRKLLRQVGVLGMSSATKRLTEVLQMKPGEDAVRTGRLYSSIRAGVSGNGGGDTVFELSDAMVEVGTNVPYAAQRQYGGTIFPKAGNKALAIPLPIALKRARLSPKDIDPSRELLTFIPIRSGKPGVIGLLVDEATERRSDGATKGRKKKPRGHTAFGPGALYVLMSSVEQEGTPFLYWSEEDKRVINEELWPRFLNRP